MDACMKLEWQVRVEGMFSKNDVSSDLTTESIPYLVVDFMAAACSELVMEERLKHLQVSKAFYLRFLERILQYKLFDTSRPEAKVLKKFLIEDYDEAEEGKLLSWFQNPSRDLKIDRMKQIMSTKSVLKQMLIPQSDEDQILAYWTVSLRYFSLQALDSLSLVLKEIELLEAGNNPAPKPPAESPERKQISKISQPFKLVRDRKQVADSVFSHDYNLPTMTIDEYLDLEMKRGNIISGGGAASAIKAEPDEDDEAYQEAQLLKDREWDEFKDMYKRGSGNTYNRS